MPRRALIFLLAIAAVLGGCGRPAEAARVRHYQDHGIAFDCPPDWKLQEAQTEGGDVIYLEDPWSGVTALGIFPAGLKISLEEYTASYLKNMVASLPPKAVFRQTGTSVTPAMTDVKFVLKLDAAELPSTVNVSRHEFGNLTVFCVTQIADEDRRKAQAGFDLIRRTLAASGAKPES